MYDQIREDTLFIILYTIVTTIAAMAGIYLLFRRSNAIVPDVMPPARLRRWTAAFFAALALNHLWYMPIFFLSSSEDIMLCDLIGGFLDSITVFPLMIVVLFTMLQDRRRPLWPAYVMMSPIIVASAWCVTARSYALLTMGYIYALLMCMGLIIYMVCALRRYGRWLRDNFADLEHKEVWQSFVGLAIIMLLIFIYVFIYEGQVYQYAMQVICIVFVFYLLWRVETLSDLTIPQSLDATEESPVSEEQATHKDLGQLLQKFCIDAKLYLQHDLTVIQLAKTIGTNRTYLSRYFSSQGTTYNAYINGLRIQHFINLYHQSAAIRQSVTAQQLAYQSGFRSYSTFSAAFKQVKGMTATEWMRLSEK